VIQHRGGDVFLPLDDHGRFTVFCLRAIFAENRHPLF
jgi:hypothetical protein